MQVPDIYIYRNKYIGKKRHICVKICFNDMIASLFSCCYNQHYSYKPKLQALILDELSNILCYINQVILWWVLYNKYNKYLQYFIWLANRGISFLNKLFMQWLRLLNAVYLNASTGFLFLSLSQCVFLVFAFLLPHLLSNKIKVK